MPKLTGTDISIICAMLEQERGEEVLDVIERPNAWVFKFKNSRPHVIPKSD